MNEQIDQFFEGLRTKVDEAERRVKDLNATAKTAAEKAQKQVTAQLATLDAKAKQHRANVEAAGAKAKQWLDEKKIATAAKIESWKAQQEVKLLAARAKLAEDYAAASITAAASAIDEAEGAVVEAIGARLDAEAVK